MPEFLESDRVTLTLAEGVPTVELTDVEVSGAQWWSLLNKATMLVVDGPGDEGFSCGGRSATVPTSRPTAGTRRSPHTGP
ncbi:hypothetical protein GCM10022415_13360 [Knoellia locipacati]|uniref:Uncharacterized protein n=1 Tax=Knoellia locipacati TaxID=882824 RepID=A0A512SZB4_9MICO|nr:hypothetical protein [Knoellia locipacati]GEQ13286.1 hypothetical protein KLO01_13330 [Knoellia locipacati]